MEEKQHIVKDLKCNKFPYRTINDLGDPLHSKNPLLGENHLSTQKNHVGDKLSATDLQERKM